MPFFNNSNFCSTLFSRIVRNVCMLSKLLLFFDKWSKFYFGLNVQYGNMIRLLSFKFVDSNLDRFLAKNEQVQWILHVLKCKYGMTKNQEIWPFNSKFFSSLVIEAIWTRHQKNIFYSHKCINQKYAQFLSVRHYSISKNIQISIESIHFLAKFYLILYPRT